MDIQYKALSCVDPSPRLTRLFRELTGREEMTPDTERINSLIAEGKLGFYTAWLDGNLVGMTSIVPCRTAQSDKLWIEDVAVLSECRGLGIGRALLSFAMDDATQRFFKGTFWLTSRPSRQAARKLYASMGLEPYDTGVFFKCTD